MTVTFNPRPMQVWQVAMKLKEKGLEEYSQTILTLNISTFTSHPPINPLIPIYVFLRNVLHACIPINVFIRKAIAWQQAVEFAAA